jgi:hypothetical protein
MSFTHNVEDVVQVVDGVGFGLSLLAGCPGSLIRPFFTYVMFAGRTPINTSASVSAKNATASQTPSNKPRLP